MPVSVRWSEWPVAVFARQREAGGDASWMSAVGREGGGDGELEGSVMALPVTDLATVTIINITIP